MVDSASSPTPIADIFAALTITNSVALVNDSLPTSPLSWSIVRCNSSPESSSTSIVLVTTSSRITESTSSWTSLSLYPCSCSLESVVLRFSSTDFSLAILTSSPSITIVISLSLSPVKFEPPAWTTVMIGAVFELFVSLKVNLYCLLLNKYYI